MRVLPLTALVLCVTLIGIDAHAADYSVTNNPYAAVNWSTTLRCLSQTHDHVTDATGIVSSYNAAGYCATTASTYSGHVRPMTAGEWAAAGNPNPDPGIAAGWLERKWPPQDYGQPTMPMSSLLFYVPGAEEVHMAGTTTKNETQHLYSAGMTAYVEGAGCTSCGQSSVPVRNNNPLALPDSQRAFYSGSWTLNTDSQTKMAALGARVTLNHPYSEAGGAAAFDGMTLTHSIEVFNNYHQLYDEGCANGEALAYDPTNCTCATRSYVTEFGLIWDRWLEQRSARVWGVAVNDHAGPWKTIGGNPGTACWPVVTAANRDRGKMEMLVTAQNLTAWLAAYDAGAFFAISESNATKRAYPVVTNIFASPFTLELTTQAGTETVTWIGDGAQQATGYAISLVDLPASLVYLRAVITDAAGRTLWVQPFELGSVPARAKRVGSGISGGGTW